MYTKEQQADNRKAWIAALKSGEYRQARGRLHYVGTQGQPDSFCCLGVACDLALKAGVPLQKHQVNKDSEKNAYVYDGRVSVLPGKVQDWLGLIVADPRAVGQDNDMGFLKEGRSLVSANDCGMSFHDIANLIETGNLITS